MITGLIGVAISTTGDEHRLDLLRQSIQGWRRSLPLGSVLLVTVDGDEAAAERVRQVLREPDGFGLALRVGQSWTTEFDGGRQGVAVNKNTGIEALMEQGVEHLFLSDDDTWPLLRQSLTKHMDYLHSMVCWGQHRLAYTQSGYAAWKWPRGVMMYVRRSVVDRVGGMVEEFGPGGHEHVEWSQRIHNAGFTEEPFISPGSYAEAGPSGAATRASALWHCEDMRRPKERLSEHAARKAKLTSVRRQDGDWEMIERVMARQQGSKEFVPYTAAENGRSSATLCTAPSQGAVVTEGDEK